MSEMKQGPEVTMEELQEAGRKWLEAGKEYWEKFLRSDANKSGGSAVVWYSASDTGLVIFTRGEYREQLLYNIEGVGEMTFFGGAPDDISHPGGKEGGA